MVTLGRVLCLELTLVSLTTSLAGSPGRRCHHKMPFSLALMERDESVVRSDVDTLHLGDEMLSRQWEDS